MNGTTALKLLADALRSGSDKPPGGMTRQEILDGLVKEFGMSSGIRRVEQTLSQLVADKKLRVVKGNERQQDGSLKRKMWYVPSE